jgi:hypothetical protein
LTKLSLIDSLIDSLLEQKPYKPPFGFHRYSDADLDRAIWKAIPDPSPCSRSGTARPADLRLATRATASAGFQRAETSAVTRSGDLGLDESTQRLAAMK